MTSLKAQLAKLIRDPQVDIVDAAGPNPRPATPPSGLDTEMFHALEHAQQQIFPGIPTIPIMQAGATDSSELRAKGVQAYGIGTPSSADDQSRIHGNDERVEIAGFGKFVEFLYAATVEIAGAK
jgi:acetylornithine deacetylase/succinyl-diaminopimelate desuccinylase-like protein